MALAYRIGDCDLIDFHFKLPPDIFDLVKNENGKMQEGASVEVDGTTGWVSVLSNTIYSTLGLKYQKFVIRRSREHVPYAPNTAVVVLGGSRTLKVKTADGFFEKIYDSGDVYVFRGALPKGEGTKVSTTVNTFSKGQITITCSNPIEIKHKVHNQA